MKHSVQLSYGELIRKYPQCDPKILMELLKRPENAKYLEMFMNNESLRDFISTNLYSI
jgi:hypothetical protein